MLLLRELVCARAWLAVIHHVAGVLTGVLLAFCAAFVAAGLAGLPLALLGLPLLGLGLRLTGWGARFDRHHARGTGARTGRPGSGPGTGCCCRACPASNCRVVTSASVPSATALTLTGNGNDVMIGGITAAAPRRPHGAGTSTPRSRATRPART
jgi:hypothetical protein